VPQPTKLPTFTLELQLIFQGNALQILHINTNQQLFIGDAPECDFFLAGVPKTPLITITAEGPALCFSEESSGYLSGALRTPLSDLQGIKPHHEDPGLRTVLLRLGACYVMNVGSRLVLRLRSVAPPVPLSREAKKDRSIWSYTAASALLHSLLLILFFQVSPEARSLDLTLLQSKNLLARVQAQPTEENPEEIPTWLSEKMRSGLIGEQEGRMHNGPSGAMGKKHAKHQQGLYQLKGQDPHLARQQAEAVAQQAGIIALIKGSAAESSPFASVFGKETMVGADPQDILGGLLGERLAEAEGGYGLGLRGTGFGGNYKGEGTLGAGSWGLSGAGAGGSCDATCRSGFLGHGSGTGTGIGKDKLEKKRTHTAGAPEAMEGRVTVVGSLDKDVIRRVIKRAMPAIKYCYEQGLLQNKNLAGKVSIYFVISNNGTVASATPKAGISATVDQCVAKKISQLAFPNPGGLVEVTYPFVFQATK
jgi:hypothetical protein